ncbi:MAG: hypothetical protein AB8I08_05755 [Sandaracinaceae bacterium]
MRVLHRVLPLLVVLSLVGCDDDRSTVDAGRVDSGGSDAGPSVDAAIDAGATCTPVTCELACMFGFVRDTDGCEICECAPEPDNSCTIPDDCGLAERPDCCSCVEAYANSQIDADRCLVRAGEATPPGCEPDPEVCAVVDCIPCESATSVNCEADVCTGVR